MARQDRFLQPLLPSSEYPHHVLALAGPEDGQAVRRRFRHVGDGCGASRPTAKRPETRVGAETILVAIHRLIGDRLGVVWPFEDRPKDTVDQSKAGNTEEREF